MESLDRKYARLKRILKSYGSLLVAYSGGVDSTLLIKVASDVLGPAVLAVTAVSPTYQRSELLTAKAVAKRLGVRLRVIKSDELSDERFSRNAPDRCYWCKRKLVSRLKEIAAGEGLARVAVASQADDLGDYRPGETAAAELGAVSPLREAGLGKSDIRRLSRRLGIPGWGREAMACLASRIPYGDRIDRVKLRCVARAEETLRGMGFSKVRVRHHGSIARIEVDERAIGRLARPSLRREIVRRLKRLGFLYVSVDLQGYRTGSMNEQLRRRRWGRAALHTGLKIG